MLDFVDAFTKDSIGEEKREELNKEKNNNFAQNSLYNNKNFIFRSLVKTHISNRKYFNFCVLVAGVEKCSKR